MISIVMTSPKAFIPVGVKLKQKEKSKNVNKHQTFIYSTNQFRNSFPFRLPSTLASTEGPEISSLLLTSTSFHGIFSFSVRAKLYSATQA